MSCVAEMPARTAVGPRAAPGTRYESLDGLRGLAAVYVLLHHVAVTSDYFSSPVLNQGWRAVVVFFVLSGFVLALPMIRKGEAGDLRRYAKRRAVRIVPPYYAALAFSAAVAPWTAGEYRNHVLPITPAGFASHLAFLHNFEWSWAYKINPAHWSIAFEWQFYFLLPLVLLPLWRRFGLLAPCVLTLALSAVPGLRPIPRWFAVSTFAFCAGIAAAGVVTRSVSARRATALLLVALGLSAASRTTFNPSYVATVGGSALAIVLLCRLPGSAPARLLGSRTMTRLGDMSYSLYLTHYPVVVLLAPIVSPHRSDPQSRCAALAAVALPACLGVGWMFYAAFERPAVRWLKEH